MSNKFTEPPLGIIPKKIHDSMRMHEILDAMQRYSQAGMTIPVEWIVELRELVCL